jgi:hypothetical protein
VRLKFWINDRRVLSYRPPSTVILSPGRSGLEVFPFTDVDGPVRQRPCTWIPST